MMWMGLMLGGVWMGPLGGYSLSALHGHGKGVAVLMAWELGTAAWQVEMALGPLACHSPCMPYPHGDLSPFQASIRTQMS